MFLQSEDHNIDDFLSAVNFIAPQGFNLKYFIIPYAANNTVLAGNALNNGYEQYIEPERNAQDVKGITDTITYIKKDMKDRQSFNDSGFNLNQIPNEFPITRQGDNPTLLNGEQIDVIKDGAEIKSPISGVLVSESKNNYVDIKLTENVGCFPKHTLFHFIKNNLNENKDIRVNKFTEDYEGDSTEDDSEVAMSAHSNYSENDEYYDVDKLCTMACRKMEKDWFMSDDDKFADYKNALFFCRTAVGFMVKGRLIELTIDGTYFDVDNNDSPEEVWIAICNGLGMKKLENKTKAASLIDGCCLDIRW